jgi:hypothetical protein
VTVFLRAVAGGDGGCVDLVTRTQLLADGVTDQEIRRWVRAGDLVRVRPGGFTRRAAGSPAERHRLAVLAAVAELAPDAVVSHASAAVLHGLPVHAQQLRAVRVTRRRRRSGARRGRHVHVHCAPLDPEEVVIVDGVAVTSLARTLLDLARTSAFDTAVVAADAALHQHRVTRADLDAAVVRARRWPGLPAARRALAFARPGAVNPGETLSRIAIHRAGLPPPELQWVVRTVTGLAIAETDFGWPALRTVGEFDGRVKYGRLLAPGQDPGEVVYEEKRREDAVRATDLGMVRWGWAELDDFRRTAEDLRRSFRPV